MKEELVSIITPMYNAEKYIAQTIESVQKQSYQNWEMLIIDDASTDKSEEIVKKYSGRDKRIKYHRQNKNCGIANARNTAIKMAQGTYLAFLDSDDMWKNDKLEKQIQYMQKEDIAFCYSACEIVDSGGSATGKIRSVPLNIDYRTLLKGNYIPCLTVVLDRKKIDNIEMSNISHEDYATWLNILKQGIVAYGINEVLASYRVNNNSVSGNKLRAISWSWNIYRKNQGLGFLKSSYYLIYHIFNAVKKRL